MLALITAITFWLGAFMCWLGFSLHNRADTGWSRNLAYFIACVGVAMLIHALATCTWAIVRSATQW